MIFMTPSQSFTQNSSQMYHQRELGRDTEISKAHRTARQIFSRILIVRSAFDKF